MRIPTHATSVANNTVNRETVAVKSGVKADGLPWNHNTVAVSCGVKAGGFKINHNAVVVKSGIQAGGLTLNQNAVAQQRRPGRWVQDEQQPRPADRCGPALARMP